MGATTQYSSISVHAESCIVDSLCDSKFIPLVIFLVLLSIQLLLAEPNPDDGLMQDISVQYNRPQFIETAEQWIEKYAKNECEESQKRVADNIDHSDINLSPRMSKKE